MNHYLFMVRRILCPRYVDAGRNCADAHTHAEHDAILRSQLDRISSKTRRIEIGTFLQNCLDRGPLQSDEWLCKETIRWHGPRNRPRRR